jgi:glycosyltransferase involved in cell wall biosynthesis
MLPGGRTAVSRLLFAVPFHRHLGYLRAAVASAQAQTRSDWRLVVCDDRGEPEAAVQALVTGFADPRVTWRGNERNLGMVGNWNRALDAADADFVTLLHADDRLLPHYAETLLALGDEYPHAVAACCAARLIDACGRPTWTVADAVKRLLVPRAEPWTLRGETGLQALLRGDFVMCPTIAWRVSKLAGRRFDARWRQVQDLELLSRLLLDGEEIVGTHRVAYAYRRHSQSATAIQTESLLRFEEEIALYDRVGRLAGERGWPGAARTARRRAIVRLHLAFRALADLVSRRPAVAARKLRMAVARSARSA